MQSKGNTGKAPSKTRFVYFPRTPVRITNAGDARYGGGVGYSYRLTGKGGWVAVGSPHYKALLAAAKAGNLKLVPTHSVRGYTSPATWKGGWATGNPPKNAAQPTATSPDPVKGSTAAAPKMGPAPGSAAGRAASSRVNSLSSLIGSPNVGSLIPRSDAAAQATAEFGPAIAQLQQQIHQTSAQNAQDLTDIANWYGQAQNQINQAAAQGQQSAQGAANADAGTTNSLMNAIGGSGNIGSGAVAAQGSANQALQQALGTVDQQYAQNMAPQMSAQAGGATAAQNALNSQAISALQGQLSGLTQQRGAAQQNALMQIIEANNQLSQQRFANQLSKAQSLAGIQSLGGSMQLQQAELAGQNEKNQAQSLANQVAQQQMGSSPNSTVAWSDLSPSQQLQLATGWASAPGIAGSSNPLAAMENLAAGSNYGGPALDNYLQTYLTGQP